MKNKKILNEVLQKDLGLILLYGINGSFIPLYDYSIIKDEKENLPIKVCNKRYALDDTDTYFYDDSFVFECNDKQNPSSAIMIKTEDLLEFFENPLDEKTITKLKNSALSKLMIKDSFETNEKTYSISNYDLYVLINLKQISDNYSVIPYVKNSNNKNIKKTNFNYIDRDEELKNNFTIKTL